MTLPRCAASPGPRFSGPGRRAGPGRERIITMVNTHQNVASRPGLTTLMMAAMPGAVLLSGSALEILSLRQQVGTDNDSELKSQLTFVLMIPIDEDS